MPRALSLKGAFMKRRSQAGTSLVELLVVIVIFAIGILGVVQLFPAGFQALNNERNRTIANELGRGQLEAIKGRPSQLPEEILAVRVQGGAIIADPDRDNNNLGPVGQGIDQAGNVLGLASEVLGPWGQLSGANVVKRVVGEGGRVPAPRTAGGFIGGLLVLQFAPILNSPSYPFFLSVYGNDMIARFGQPFGGAFNRPYEFFVSDEDDNGNPGDTLFLAQIPLPASPTESPYRVNFSFFVDNGGTIRLRELVDVDPAVLRAALVPSTNYFGYWTISVPGLIAAAGALQPGETYAGLDDASVRVQRNFLRLNLADVFTNNPYEYKLLDPSLGVLLFNPAGYNYQERTLRGVRVPLVARVNYDVLDWRIIRDEFRIPSSGPFQQKLAINSLAVQGEPSADGLPYPGLGVPIPDGNGGTRNVDVVLLDVDSGGIFLHDPRNPGNPVPQPGVVNDFLDVDPNQTAYVVDKSAGLMRFADLDPATPGVQMRIILPGQAAPVTVNASGRKVRALYRGKGEWAVQVMKAASRYQVVLGRPSVSQCYVGASTTFGGQPTRIYFPGQDTGKKVTIGEIWYTNGAVVQTLRDVDFLITNSPADPLGLPYIDIRSVDSQATSFDFSNNYAVRRVKGSSVAARVLWNPATFRLTNDSAANLSAFEAWGRNWRRVTVETYLEKGEN